MRPLLLILGLLFVALPTQAWWSTASNSGSLVLAILPQANDSDVIVPPITVAADQFGQCLSSSWNDTMPMLEYFKVSAPQSSLVTYSFGCNSGCSDCSLTGTANVSGVRVYNIAAMTAMLRYLSHKRKQDASPIGEYFLQVFGTVDTANTLTTFIFVDPACSNFFWPSTPEISTNGECVKSRYFDGELCGSLSPALSVALFLSLHLCCCVRLVFSCILYPIVLPHTIKCNCWSPCRRTALLRTAIGSAKTASTVISVHCSLMRETTAQTLSFGQTTTRTSINQLIFAVLALFCVH